MTNFLCFTIFGCQKAILVLLTICTYHKVLWFSEEQKFQFLSCPLLSVCLVSKTVLQIKHYTIEVVMTFIF